MYYEKELKKLERKLERKFNIYKRRVKKYNIEEDPKFIVKMRLTREWCNVFENMDIISEYIKNEWEQRKLKRIFNNESKKRSRL